MQAYSELVPPTAVTHAVALAFLGAKSQNLIIVKSSLLQIYDVKTVRADRSSQAQKKLVFIAEYALAGSVTSLASIRVVNSKSGGEALLIAVKDAKVSLVEWDPDIYGLSTLSIHYYESEELLTSPWAPDMSHYPSFLIVDPSHRCAALKFGSNRLAILPFKQQGDDLVAGDYDPDIDGPAPLTQSAKKTEVNGESKEPPYAASFVLPLVALDPSLIHIIDLKFLYEYREPTLGVLSGARSPSAALLHDRKDVLSYTIFTLDIEQHARTPLLSVTGLPSDLWKMVPLPLPVGGALLLGTNELIHVDQSGKASAVAVNEFAHQTSSFSMADQSELGLKLEDCVVCQPRKDSGDLIIILNTGDLVLLSFKVDGRSISSFNLERVPGSLGGNLLASCASCAVPVGRDTVFIGSEDADSLLISRDSKRPQLSKKRSHAEMLGLDAEATDEESADEDDLYAETSPAAREHDSNRRVEDSSEQGQFIVQDRLVNLTATAEPVVGHAHHVPKINGQDLQTSNILSLVMPIGKGVAGSLALMSKDIRPSTKPSPKLPQAQDMWVFSTTSNPRNQNHQSENSEPDADLESELDSHLVSTDTTADGAVSSMLYFNKNGRFEQTSGSDFETDCLTIGVGTLCGATRVVQVSQMDLRCYNSELGLEQIVPVIDEETEPDVKILHVSFSDPYILLIRNDRAICLLKANDSGEVEEIDPSPVLQSYRWLSGSIYTGPAWYNRPYAFLLTEDGVLQVFDLESLSEPVYTVENLAFLTPILSQGQSSRRTAAKASVAEILATDIGDSINKSFHLTVRTENDDIIIYQPFDPAPSTTQSTTNWERIRWIKVTTSLANELNATLDGESSSENALQRLRLMKMSDGHFMISVTGLSPRIVLKTHLIQAKVFRLQIDGTHALIGVNLPGSGINLISIDSKKMITCSKLAEETDYSTGWAISRVPMGEEISRVGYHSESGLFVIGVVQQINFRLPEDDWHQEWAKEDVDLKPNTLQGCVRLLDPNGWHVVNEFRLQDDEMPLSLRIMSLEVSEHTHERRLLIGVGTGIPRGEDLACNGHIYIFDIVRVVPEEDKPYTNMKLKVIAQEEVRGAVTALSDIGNHGFLLAAQGQKCMVRGLKDDNSLLPIAFMDMQCYITVLKNIKGSGLALMADAMKGIWLTGFSEEPCKMRLFGKSRSNLEVVAADFLPFEKQLHIIATDTNCDVHVLEFNPEDPKSLSGQRLLQKSTFHLGYYPVSVTNLPLRVRPVSLALPDGDVEMDGISDKDGEQENEETNSASCLLIATQSGAVGLISSVDEAMYRRLGALQTHLTNNVEHYGGLNPRAYRAVESEGFGSKGILDGQILKRWIDLSSQRRAEVCARIGAEEWQIRADLSLLSGTGLDYL